MILIQEGDSSCWLTVRMWYSFSLALAVLQHKNIPALGCALQLLLTQKNRRVLAIIFSI